MDDVQTVVTARTPPGELVQTLLTLGNRDNIDPSKPIPHRADMAQARAELGGGGFGPSAFVLPTIPEAVSQPPLPLPVEPPVAPTITAAPPSVAMDEFDDAITRSHKLSVLRMYIENGVVLSKPLEFYQTAPMAFLDSELKSIEFHVNASMYSPMLWNASCKLVEFLETQNRKLGPFLNLDGWTQRYSAHEAKMRPVMQKAYFKYFSAMNGLSVEMQLLMTMVMSASPLTNGFQEMLVKPDPTTLVTPQVTPFIPMAPPPPAAAAAPPTMKPPSIETRPPRTPHEPSLDVRKLVDERITKVAQETQDVIERNQARTDREISELNSKLGAILSLLQSQSRSPSRSASETSEESV